MIRTIIVDDELKSRESLKILLEDFCEGVTVNALCQNIDEALEAIASYRPEIVFLDIHLQRESGFDLLARLKDTQFEVIFTTAFSEYAIRAFKFSAIDYLLKPIDVEELRGAISKVEKKRNGQANEKLLYLIENLKNGAANNYKIALPTSNGLVFIKADAILYCEASGNYTEITTDDNKKYIVSRTLKDYEDILESQNFYRIHHSYLINLNGVKQYVRGEGGYVIMSNDKSLDVSKRKKEGFLLRIGGKG